MSQWAQSKYTPGQFLGSTDVRVLSVKELAAGNQAWARKNQLIDTQPVNSGMGLHLLKKMGWKDGEGLGKESNGSLTPLLLELKLDKRGLEANEEVSVATFLNIRSSLHLIDTRQSGFPAKAAESKQRKEGWWSTRWCGPSAFSQLRAETPSVVARGTSIKAAVGSTQLHTCS